MFKSYWVAAIWIGLNLSVAAAQQVVPATPETIPNQEIDQPQSGPASQENTAEYKEIALDLLAVINRIEASIREAIPEVDQGRLDRDEERNRRDLQAQEDMAFWALLMTVASIVTVSLTGVGVFFIWRTLLYTRGAAMSAADAVAEARRATGAARDAVSETTRIGEAQVRAYVTVGECTIRFEDGKMVPRFAIRNTGQSPARAVIVTVSLGVEPDIKRLLQGDLVSSVHAPGDIAPSMEPYIYDHPFTENPFRGGMNPATPNVNASVMLTVTVSYKDVFKTEISEAFHFWSVFVGETGADWLRAPVKLIAIPPFFMGQH